jgi:hypothetical protein
MINDETTADLEQQDTNSQEEEVLNDSPEQSKEEAEADTKDWKAEALKFKAILDRNKNKSEPKETSKKSNGDLDYGQKAYLATQGIKPNEFDFVQAELKASGESLDTLLENNYFKARLEKNRELSKTANATPTGKRSSGVATESVEYYMAIAGPNAENLDKVPKDMRAKVVDAMVSKEKNKGIFYNS